MKKIFITGGSGTIGKAFISKYYKKYKFYSYARNEKNQVSLKRNFPNIEIIIGGIENKNLLDSELLKVKPDIIIHAAALKHVDTAEKQPSQAVLINIIGSYNIIDAAKSANVPITIGISTDKACKSENIYGQSKKFMEKLFQEANNKKNKFACCRFGNVTWSSGSVIPYWMSKHKNGEEIPLTHKNMTRLMFSSDEAAELIHKSIDICNSSGGFILSKKMKKVLLYDLAKIISKKIKIVGLRPGEKLYEDLISKKELPFTEIIEDYVLINQNENDNLDTRLSEEYNSNNAEIMNDKELKKLLNNSENIASRTIIDEKLY